MSRLTILYFALAALIAAAAGSLAAYTSLSSAKRVVTVKGTEQYFTSDVLMKYEKSDESDLQIRGYSFGGDEETKRFSLVVSNHLQGDMTKYDPKNTDYTFKLELLDAQGQRVTDSSLYSQLSVNGTAMGQNPVSLAKTLPGGSAVDQKYEISFTGEDILACRIKITAITTRDGYDHLGRIITFATDSTSTNWSGSFIKTEQTAYSSDKELAMINYRLSGHVEEDGILKWNPSRVTIDPSFLTRYADIITGSGVDGDEKYVQLHLGKEGTPQQYMITFYRTYAQKDLKSETWNDVEGYISFERVNS